MHATTTNYLYHLFRTLSPTPPAAQPSPLPLSQPSSPPTVLIIPYIDIPQHENTLASIPRSIHQLCVRLALLGRFLSLHSVPLPPPLHRVHYIAQKSGLRLRLPVPPSCSSCYLPSPFAPPRFTRLHIRTTNTLGSIPDSIFRSSPGNIIELEDPNPSRLFYRSAPLLSSLALLCSAHSNPALQTLLITPRSSW